MKIQTGLSTNNRQEIDKENAIEGLLELGFLAPRKVSEEVRPEVESILSHGPFATLYNLAFLAGITVMLVGFGSALEGSPLASGLWNMDLFLPGMILLLTGLGLGALGGSGSEYA